MCLQKLRLSNSKQPRYSLNPQIINWTHEERQRGGLEESEITGELENGVDLRNRFGAILFCRITKDLCLGSIANDQVLPHGPDLNSLFENRGSWGKVLDPAEKQLMGYRRQ